MQKALRVPLTRSGKGWFLTNEIPAGAKVQVALDQGHYPDPQLILSWEEIELQDAPPGTHPADWHLEATVQDAPNLHPDPSLTPWQIRAARAFGIHA